MKYFAKLFGTYQNTSYLSSINEAAKPSGSVKRSLLTIRVSFPRGSKTLPLSKNS